MSQSKPTDSECTIYATEYILHGSQAKAFKKAFPNSIQKGKALHVAASRFHDIAKVLLTIDQLRQPIESNVRNEASYTIEDALRELEEARALGIQEKQVSAAVSASMGKAKIKGLIVDKQDIKSEVNASFAVTSSPMTAEEWLANTQKNDS